MSLLDIFRPRASRGVVRKSNDMSASAIVRANANALGVWGGALNGFVPREVNPYFYEALRSALAPIDGGIARLVTMDGILRVEGGNDKLVQAIQARLFAEIPVNDLEGGVQAFYASQSNELYEQGFSVGEMVMSDDGKELIGLRVADSKGVHYRRGESLALETWYRPPSPLRTGRADGTDQIESVLRNNASRTRDWLTSNDFTLLAPASLVYTAFNPESANPYGVSVMRSMEFVAQILLRIQNATGRVWDRFGDPAFQLTYKTANRALKAEDLDKRRAALGVELAKVLDAKRSGNSADFVQALGKDDDITIKAIGSDGQIIELEMPARHMMEQILAKFGLPAWMLGMQWSTAERMAEQQSTIVLQEARTRFERRLVGLNKIVATWLRGRGYTWKDGDWKLVQELPRLEDMLKEAQAEFLNAQTAMMRDGVTPNITTPPGKPPSTGVDNAPAKSARIAIGNLTFDLPARKHAHKDAAVAEPWAEDDPALPKIEQRAIDGVLALWGDLRAAVFRALKLTAGKSARKSDLVWSFDPLTMLQDIANAQQVFVDAAGAEEGPLLQEAFRAWVRGLENAASEFDADAAIEATNAQMRDTLRSSALESLRDATARSMQDDILSELTSGAYDGLNPNEVAAKLAERFDVHDYDWERLARSEIAAAQSLGKDAQYAAMGVTQYDWVTAGGACPTCNARADDGPYNVGQGPLPSRDSHPNCFPAGTIVHTPGLIGSSTRGYSGEFIKLVTASGHELSVTPNHPILTTQGWIAAGLIKQGQHVLRCADPERVIAHVVPDDDNTPALIEDVAETLRGALSVATMRMPISAEDFHGDGMDSDVQVVGANRALSHRTNIAEHRGESALGIADMELPILPGSGAQDFTLLRIDVSAARSMRGLGEARSLARRCALHANAHAGTSVARINALADQEARESWTADSSRLGERLQALAGLVTADEVVSVGRFTASQNVYNLETKLGWYVAAGIIAHNCRCTIVSRDPDETK